MSPFYTSLGDNGTTGLLGEGRVPKNHPQIEAVGAIDEASAALGVARAACQSSLSKSILPAIQRDLYKIMAETAATPENAERFRSIDPERVSWLEEQTALAEGMIEMPKEFILPGDTPAGAALDLARTVVRRAERRVAELILGGMLNNPQLLRYLNRLSSLLFVLELVENHEAGEAKPSLAKG